MNMIAAFDQLLFSRMHIEQVHNSEEGLPTPKSLIICRL